MSIKITTEDFIKRAKKIHGDLYDYSKTEYKGIYTKVNIVCPVHGVFKQTPNNHLSGRGCHLCSSSKSAETRKLTTDIFIERARKAHKDKYDYSKANYTGQRKKIIIICSKHGEFKQSPIEHWGGKGCPKCSSSKGEELIIEFLNKKKIKYIVQYRFENCRDKNTLPFDFYLPNYNLCIEYDGVGHYKAQPNWGGEKAFKRQKMRDLIKDNYCNNNNIKLIRIPYWEKENINSILELELEI